MNQFSFKTKYGPISIESNNGKVTRISFASSFSTPKTLNGFQSKCIKEIEKFLEGKSTEINLPYELTIGTEFQKKVWKRLKSIKYGKTNTYKDIAEQVKSPKAFRAVGMSCNKNPLPLIIPCHRVVGTNGSLTGFAGGINLKRHLLDLESK